MKMDEMSSNLYDLDLERAILSAILYDEESYSKISFLISENDFYLAGHREIYKAIKSCINNDEPITEAFIKKYLGKEYNEQILADVVSTGSIVDIEKYANELKEKSVRRELLGIAHNIPAVINEPTPSRDIVDTLSAQIYSLVDENKNGKIKDAREIVAEMAQELKETSKRENSDVIGLDTGFGYINAQTKGLKPGELIIIAARPGMGKTTFALNLIQKALDHDKGVVFFSLEMGASDIAMRMLSAKTSIPFSSIKSANFASDDEYARFSDASNDLLNKKFFVHDSGYVTIHQIRTNLRKLKTKHEEISLCVIDYIGLMMSSQKYSERHLQIAEISRGLKLLARELNIPIVALSQLNRGVESRTNKRPMLSDLRESGAVEQDADLVLFVYRDAVYAEQEENSRRQAWINDGKNPDEYTPVFIPNQLQEEIEIIIGKNRNGGLGTAKAIYRKQCFHISDAASIPLMEAEFQG